MKRLHLLTLLIFSIVLLQAQDLKPSKDKATKKYGYINKSKEWVIKAQFDKAKKFSDGAAEVIMNDKVGLINTSGEYIVEPKYDDIASFKDGFAEVKLNKKIGLVDKTGKEIVSPKYDKIDKFINNIAVVELDDKKGLITIEGTEILAPQFGKINGFKDGIAIVENGDKKGMIKEDGTIILDANYQDIANSGDQILAQSNSVWGVFKADGKPVFEPQFLAKPNFNGAGNATVMINGKAANTNIDMKKYGVISRDGTYKLKCEHFSLDFEDNWYFAIHETKGWIIYNSDFSVVKENIDGLQKCGKNYFNNGICAYKSGEKWGFIDKNFKVVIPCNFDKIYHEGFNNGYCAVQVGDKWGFIKPDGSYKFQPTYTEVDAGFKNIGGTKTATVWEGKKKYALKEDGTKTLMEDLTPPPATTTTTTTSSSSSNTSAQNTTATPENNDWLLGKWNVYEEKVGTIQKGTSCKTHYYNFTSKRSVTVNEYDSYSMKYKDNVKSCTINGTAITIGTLKCKATNISADKRSMTITGPLGTYWKVKK